MRRGDRALLDTTTNPLSSEKRRRGSGRGGARASNSHTSIGSAGDEFVATFTADYYQTFMLAWEKALNHFLKTGCRLGAKSTA